MHELSLNADNEGHVAADGLSGNQLRALYALLASPSIRAAARACGLNERTIRRYLKDPVFAKAYSQERSLLLAETVASLQTISLRAIEALSGALEDTDVDARIRAARAVLDFLFRGVDTERRIKEVEEWAREIEELKRELA